MQITLSKYQDDENEKDRAKAYWSEQNTQLLAYELKSHYVEVIAEVLKFIETKSVFEFGCAAGRNLKALHEIFSDELNRELLVTGVDINEPAVKRGKEEFGLDISVGDEAHMQGIKTGSFDLVFTVSVLDHVPKPSEIVKLLMNISSQYGVFIEPWIDSDESQLGKMTNITTKWSRRKDDSANPFTYLHDYPEIFAEAGCEVVFRLPLPTHLNRSGPLYYIWFISKKSVDVVKFSKLKDQIVATACLQLLKNIQKLRGKVKVASELEEQKSIFSTKAYTLGKQNRILEVKIEDLVEQNKVLEVKTEDLAEQKKIFSAKAYKLDRKSKTQNKVIESLESSLFMEKRQLGLIQNSEAYRIGLMFIKDVKRPLHSPLMPIKLYRIYKQSKKRKLRQTILMSRQGIIKKQQIVTKINNYEILKELSGYDIDPLIPIEKRICYVIHNSLPYASGGYATRAHGVAVALTLQGYDVQVVTRAGYPLDVKDTNFTIAEDSLIDGILYRRILNPRIKANTLDNYMRQSINAYVDFFRLNRPAYVITASSFRHALPAIIAAKRLGIPSVYEVRGFWEVTRISREPGFESSRAYEYQRRMEAEAANAADQVFTLTHAMKEELVTRGVSASHIAITPNACDPDRFVPIEKNAELRELLGIPENIPVIGYIGSWVHYEGLEDLAAACGILLEKGIEFRCLIVGSENVATDTRGPIYDAIMNIVEGSKLADWVITPGRVSFDEVHDYYSLIDIAPFPRKALPVTEMVSPMKPLEALAMEKAVVVSSVGALNEMIDDGVTGLVFQKGSITDLAEKLERLISDEELRRKLGVNGRNHIVGERNWANISTVMAESIAKLDGLCTKGKDEFSCIRKISLDTKRPSWWSQLPQEFSEQCSYISMPSWVISEITQELMKHYEKKFGKKAVKKRIPVLNWKRADVCWRIVHNNTSILDIGSGLGEFVNLIAMHNPKVDITSVDTKDYDLWFDSTGRINRIYENIFNLGVEHERDVVTCFEVIEHLPPERLAEAVEKLRSLARKKLYVSMPFMEGPPLYHGHFTRFTAENILELFPDAIFTVFGKNDTVDDKVCAWILCEVIF